MEKTPINTHNIFKSGVSAKKVVFFNFLSVVLSCSHNVYTIASLKINYIQAAEPLIGALLMTRLSQAFVRPPLH